MVTVREDSEFEQALLRQDPKHVHEWLRQNSLIYGALIGIGVVMVQPFLTAATLDLAAKICVVAFSVAIPLLAALVLVNQQEVFRGRTTKSFLVATARAVAQTCAFIGVVAGFWHILWDRWRCDAGIRDRRGGGSLRRLFAPGTGTAASTRGSRGVRRHQAVDTTVPATPEVVSGWACDPRIPPRPRTGTCSTCPATSSPASSHRPARTSHWTCPRPGRSLGPGRWWGVLLDGRLRGRCQHCL
jgi:hypothetical protein